MKLYNTRLLVRDFRAEFRFYRDVLGLTPTGGGEGDVYVEFETGGALLALFRGDLMDAVVGAGGDRAAAGPDRAALVFAVADVDETVRELRAKGITFLTLPEDRPDWGIRTAHLRDPDGNLLELFSPLVR